MIVALHQILVVFRKLLLSTFSFAKRKSWTKRKEEKQKDKKQKRSPNGDCCLLSFFIYFLYEF